MGMVQDKIYTAGMLRGVFDVFQIILNGEPSEISIRLTYQM